MSNTGESGARKLAELRDRIDTIDAEMHRLLMARGTVIDALISIKGTSAPGKAFRPAREADMMRRLVARHDGGLPLATVEHIWREIITTFTRMQAEFDVAFDASFEPELMRDVARFYFGFSVDLIPLSGAAAIVAHVEEANDIGLIAVGRPAASAWWRTLTGPTSPRITAMLPFIRAAGRPADLPAFVVSPPISDPTPPDIRLFAVEAQRFESGSDCAVLVEAGNEFLVATAASLEDRDLARRPGVASAIEVGAVSRGIAIDGPGSILYRSLEPAGVER